jgi:ribosomal protein L18
MRSWIARRMLRSMSKRSSYDVSYLEYLLKESPAAFFRFAPVMKASAHREVVPVEASFAAKMAGAMAEDCGPCVQIVVDMALEAGMAKAQIEAVLRRDPKAMSANTAAAFRFADAVARRAFEEDDCREVVRARWGEKGVIDLSMALQMGRTFPMMKAALGYARECRRVTVDGHQVDVIKQAA